MVLAVGFRRCDTSIMVRRILLAAVLAASVMVVAGCAASATPSGPPPPAGNAALPDPVTSDDLIAQGTVLQIGDEDPQLCLGAVAESYPPQCSGPVIKGWDWASAEQSETASDVTWGTYAVQGTWDGTAFTVTGDVIPLSLYDPPAALDPRGEEANAGSTPESELLRVMEDLDESRSPTVVTTALHNGYLWLTVIYDDGTVQEFVDEKYGAGVVAVQSALRPVS